jgi:hypothetical protein
MSDLKVNYRAKIKDLNRKVIDLETKVAMYEEALQQPQPSKEVDGIITELRKHLRNPTGVQMALFNGLITQLIEAVRKEQKK